MSFSCRQPWLCFAAIVDREVGAAPAPSQTATSGVFRFRRYRLQRAVAGCHYRLEKKRCYLVWDQSDPSSHFTAIDADSSVGKTSCSFQWAAEAETIIRLAGCIGSARL